MPSPKMPTIKVAQIVDSLLPGGTESVAVNLANGLAEEPGFQSYLICSRAEGELKQRLQPGVTYLFLHKKRSLDVPALWKLYRFLRRHNIGIVHAHSTSFFLPVLVKWLCNFKLLWHDHYGLPIPPNGKRIYTYIPFSHFFNYAISVNDKLLDSNKKHLHVKPAQQSYLPNYSVNLPVAAFPMMKGIKSQRLICLANLRPQKDHINLLNALRQVVNEFPDVVLYCVGIGKADIYENEIRQLSTTLGLQENVVFTGSVANPFSYLQQSGIGVLSSSSEGLPLSLIEYGLAGLPVVCTDVGQCAELLEGGKNGILVPPGDITALAAALLQLLKDDHLRKQLAINFTGFVRNNYSKQAILHRLVSIYKTLN